MKIHPNLKAGASMCLLALALQASAQTTLNQNNLIPNGSFDSGSTSWSTYAGGAYYYNTTVGSETDSILSIGWWSGVNAYQNIGAVLQPGADYVLTMRALVGSSPATGVTLSLQDVSQGWANVTNASYNFPDQSQTWRVFSMYVSSNTIAGNVSDSIAVSGGLLENPSSQYGWLWIDWIQLAPAKPLFSSQPVSVTNYAGAPATFSISPAIGAVTNSSGPGSVILYQWYANGSPVANATNTTYTIAALNATNAGNYHVVASGPFGSSTSSNATLTVLPANPPIVAQAPASQNAYVNQTVQFTVGVSGTPPFHYQWTANSVALTSATNATLTLNNISAASAGTYAVTITNAFGSATTNAALTVTTPVVGTFEAAAINLQPQVYLRFSDINSTNLVINEGTLGAAADGTAEGGYVATTGPLPPSYPNFESTNPAVQYDGATADVVIPPLNLATNTGNTVTMTAWIYCYGEEANNSGILFERNGGGNASGLQIQNDANGNNILSYDWATGGRWQFASGLIIPQYQWCFTALVITPTNATLYLQDGTSMQTAVDNVAEGTNTFSGNTWVGWDSAGGSTGRRFNGIIDEAGILNRSLSATEVLSLYGASVGETAGIVTSPGAVTNYTGNPFQLSVVASGAPPLYYQWYFNNTAIAGATNATYAVAAAAVTNSGNYYVTVWNTAGNTNSAVTPVSITSSAPIFTAEPQAQTAWAGVPTTLTGTVVGTAPIAFQWYANNVALAGQTNATLTVNDPESNTTYVLKAVNGIGQTSSPGVQLTVQDPAQSAQMLYSTNTTMTWTLRSDAPEIQGVWFQTGAKSRVVTHLGYFDSTGTGLITNHWVGIYQGAPGAGNLLASVQVPAGTGPTFYQGFRWVALSAPFTLQANTNYVLAASDNNWDAWPDAFVPTWNSAYVGVTDGSTRYPMYDWPVVAWPHEPVTPITTWALNRTYGAFNLGAFPFTTALAGGGTQLQWTLGTLVSSTNVAGPYLPVSGATSPFTMPMTGTSQFYRIQY